MTTKDMVKLIDERTEELKREVEKKYRPLIEAERDRVREEKDAMINSVKMFAEEIGLTCSTNKYYIENAFSLTRDIDKYHKEKEEEKVAIVKKAEELKKRLIIMGIKSVVVKNVLLEYLGMTM